MQDLQIRSAQGNKGAMGFKTSIACLVDKLPSRECGQTSVSEKCKTG